MEISHDLRFVFPIRAHDVEKPDPRNPDKTISVTETLLWGYHTPISMDVFRANYRVFAATKDALFRKGLNYARSVGIPIADLALRDAATADAAEWGTDDSGPAIFAEFNRLTQIIASGANGFESIPADIALARKVISEDEWHDAECVVTFFTCAFSVAPRSTRDKALPYLASVFKGSMTSLTPTAYIASLAATSTQPETSLPVETTP